MASNEKNFKVKLGVTTPKVDYTLNDNVITAEMLDLATPTLSYSGSAGQLFSISDDLTGTIFSVNDISGIPSIEVNADGTVSIAEFDGNVGIGTSSPLEKLDVAGAIRTNEGIYASGDLILGANDAAVAHVKTSGEVGIGTDAPTSTLDVNGDVRIRTISNATGDFATVSATGVVQKRTAAQVLSDIGAASSGSLSGYLPLTGGTLSGNLTFSDNNEGIFLSGGAAIYSHPILSRLVLRRPSSEEDPYVGSHDGTYLYTIWHAGNLQAVTTTTNFGGDVSGTYNSIVVADDSHNHIISNVDGLQTALDGKVDENAGITAGTATKITYDAKGLVTAGTSLLAGDLPSHTHTKANITDFAHTHPAGDITGLATVATTGAYSDLSGIPSTFTPSAHTHGNISNTGAIGTTSNLVVTTTTSGVLTTSSRSGIDSRSTFPPSSHTHPVSEVSDATTVGQNIVKVTNPSAIRFLRVNADNTVSLLTNTDFRTAIGAGTSSTTGTVTSVAAGNGLSFTTITGSGSVTLGTPGTLTTGTTNSVTATSHTHAVTFPVIGAGNGVTLSSGNIVLGTPGTITSATTNSVTASSHTHALTLAAATFNNGGSGVASGTTFDGSTARTISYNTLGAPGLSAANTFTGVNTFNNNVDINGVLATDSGMRIDGSSAGTSNVAWFGFYESNGTVRHGYFGFGSPSDDHLYFYNERTGGDILLLPNSNVVKINGNVVYHEGNLPAGGGATGAGGDQVFFENDSVVTTSYTITTGKNAMSAGPVTVNNGVVVTVPTGSVWTVI